MHPPHVNSLPLVMSAAGPDDAALLIFNIDDRSNSASLFVLALNVALVVPSL